MGRCSAGRCHDVTEGAVAVQICIQEVLGSIF
jgi:hypothetical protein